MYSYEFCVNIFTQKMSQIVAGPGLSKLVRYIKNCFTSLFKTPQPIVERNCQTCHK